MKNRRNIKLNLSNQERARLRQHQLKISEILDYAVDELATILETSQERAMEIYALADFQRIPSIGIKFAEDLVFMGYFSVEQLKNQNGAHLTDVYEKKRGYQIDSCVEDQFRLAVHFAHTNDHSKNWWDFTRERKEYRSIHGYPKDRPQVIWHEIVGKTGKL